MGKEQQTGKARPIVIERDCVILAEIVELAAGNYAGEGAAWTNNDP